MKTARIKRLTFIAMLLWLIHGGLLIALAVAPEVETVTHVADLAREKDIVWLSLVTAIAAIVFSAWLVRQLVAQQSQVVKALQDLRGELGARPCIYLSKDPTLNP